MLDDNIENNWVNICRVPRKDIIFEDVKDSLLNFGPHILIGMILYKLKIKRQGPKLNIQKIS